MDLRLGLTKRNCVPSTKSVFRLRLSCSCSGSLEQRLLWWFKFRSGKSFLHRLWLFCGPDSTTTEPRFLRTKPCFWHVFILYGSPRRPSGAAFQRILGSACSATQ